MRRALRLALLALTAVACDSADASLLRHLPTASIPAPPPASAVSVRRCPPEMVDVAGRFCIDRFEAHLVDASERALSPYYHPAPELALRDRAHWSERARRIGPWKARNTPLPELPSFQRGAPFRSFARSARGKIPNAYLDLESARRACKASGKRLCKRDEWVMACRGERATRHPYGDRFERGRCNLGRLHPAASLHGKGELGELDPRMNRVRDGDGRPLLLPTGALAGCTSSWGDDRIHDMVGNLDEWIDDDSGVFLGAFYARDVAFGCDARIEIHSADYYDYTLGTRCCR